MFYLVIMKQYITFPFFFTASAVSKSFCPRNHCFDNIAKNAEQENYDTCAAHDVTRGFSLDGGLLLRAMV